MPGTAARPALNFNAKIAQQTFLDIFSRLLFKLVWKHQKRYITPFTVSPPGEFNDYKLKISKPFDVFCDSFHLLPYLYLQGLGLLNKVLGRGLGKNHWFNSEKGYVFIFI